jgi:hypothetical protein
MYVYADEGGQPLFRVCRLEPKAFYQESWDGSTWIPGLNGARRVLYRLPELLAADPVRWVLMPEGERCADLLAAKGLIATTTSGGAEKGHLTDLEPLRGRRVAVLEDNDQPGRRGGQQMGQLLYGPASEVRVLRIPDLPEHGDVADYLKAGGKVGELQRLIEATPRWSPPASLQPSPPSPPTSTTPSWPEPPEREAFYGLAGEVVDLIRPHTEADAVAVLVNFLTIFGCAVGVRPHFMVGADRHSPRLFVANVGKSSNARKGSSVHPVRQLMVAADGSLKSRMAEGLGSGEGVIYAVRDELQTVNRKTGQMETTDPGAHDKRLLVIEPEMSRVLRVMSRQTSILSAVLRRAFDDGDLQNLVKTSPLKATGAHVAMIAHITADELKRELTGIDTANGFANRFLWLLVRRSQELPSPPPLEGAAVEKMNGAIIRILKAATQIDRMKRDDHAEQLWKELYHDLSAEKDGLAGAVLGRAEAITLRASMLYALLDHSALIQTEHLKAALALWEYAERSVHYIWGRATGDPVADTIHAALLNRKEMTRTEISQLFAGHETSARISEALQLLAVLGRAHSERRQTGGGPAEVWAAG